jgi:hypothetical protein
MLRHIISVSLAMTACATLIPTKANAFSFTLTPVGSLQRNPGDSIEFLLKVNPIDPRTGSLDEITIRGISNFYHDFNELSLPQIVIFNQFLNTKLTATTTIARVISNVRQPVKDRQNDITVQVNYQLGNSFGTTPARPTGGDVEPVPEPFTMFGAAAALGYGAILKRKYSKNTES